VVIPTTGRPELARAVESIRAQQPPRRIQIIVVVDGGTSEKIPPSTRAQIDKIIATEERRGGGAARNLGIDHSDGTFVAFLDDDDYWLPTKLEEQLAAIAKQPQPDKTVMSCQHIHVAPDATSFSKPSPDPVYLRGDIAEYLFRRRRPSIQRASMYTSTLLCAGDLARSVPWSETLSRHQDWDWLVRLGAVAGVSFVQLDSALVHIQTGSNGSISSSTDWETSLQWANEALPNNAVRADFLTAQTLRYAFSARSMRGIFRTITNIVRSHRIPSRGPMLIASAGLLPRRRVTALLARGAERPSTVLMGVRQQASRNNPYIAQLIATLVASGVRVDYWTWRKAFFGKYDIVHMHWPEYILTHERTQLSVLQGLLAHAWLRRNRRSGTAIVRTVHNSKPHFALSASADRRLRELDRLTDHRVHLHEVKLGACETVIAHGDYRAQYAQYKAHESLPYRALFFGLIRPYKNVPSLIRAFQGCVDPSFQLRIVGKADPGSVSEIEMLAESDQRVSTSFGFLDEQDLASEITAASLVVLPYHDVFNSGAALLALSLSRPILIKRSTSTEQLRDEVGDEWVLLFDRDLNSADLSAALKAQNTPKTAAPDLSRRDWSHAGRQHLEVYAAAAVARANRLAPRSRAPREQLPS
jgi:beta-1,4-mannosyltransferase